MALNNITAKQEAAAAQKLGFSMPANPSNVGLPNNQPIPQPVALPRGLEILPPQRGQQPQPITDNRNPIPR